MSKYKCPICEYEFDDCQCMYSGTAHPDRQKRLEVVLEHLHLLHPEQIQHIINLQKNLCISYSDDEREQILEDMKNNYSNGNGDY